MLLTSGVTTNVVTDRNDFLSLLNVTDINVIYKILSISRNISINIIQ